MCCGDSISFDFGKLTDRFKVLRPVGQKEWPVLYDEKKQLIMIHSPVGTQSFFNDGQCKIIISGFCTSLKSCSEYLADVMLGQNEEECEVKHSFGGNGGSLRRKLEKILIGIGLYDILGIKQSNEIQGYSWEILKTIMKNPKEYSILMTQALCCIGTKEGSNADKIISSIQDPQLPYSFRLWVDNCLTDWVNMITQKSNKDCILLLLGHRTDLRSQKAAILRLLKTARIINGVVSTNTKIGESLYSYLVKEFRGRIGFLIHPANSTDATRNSYFTSIEGQKVRNIIQQIKLY